MRTHHFSLILALAYSVTASVASAQGGSGNISDIVVDCGDLTSPLLSVPDFDGSGRVDGHDIAILKRIIKDQQYSAFYDRNADGVVDKLDIKLVASAMGQHSTALDREVVDIFSAFQPLLNCY